MFPSLTVTCPALTAPDSGTVSYSTNGATTTASYTCSSEYSLAGPESRVCQSNNSWADENPTCTCIVPTAPANGSFTVAVDGTLTYYCDVGFVLNGDRTRTCQTNSNTWSGVEPTCDQCDDIVATSGLNITASATGTTTISLFSCAAGYTLDGSSNSTCLLSGSWDSSAPTCLLCEDINSTNTLQAAITTDGYVSTATFTCVTGYHVVGPSSATCDEAGAWNSIPTCECDEQTAFSNGDIEGNGTSSQFSCDAGYSLIGSSVTECLDDGTGWSADPPSCDECDSLVSPVGVYYNLSTDGVVTMATYFCSSGYTMSGQQYSYCQNDGTWNETAPTCINCPDLTDPVSGTVTINTDGVTSVAQYACASEYDISGETASTCLTDGAWDNAPPTCSCSPASVPAYGSVLSDNGVSVYYQCNLNYSMNGTSVRECSIDGTGWSGSDPICVPCETLVSVSGGSFSPTTDGVNTKVEYSCDIGYTINGKKEITCNSDGTWDSSQSTCTQCDTLTAPSGGNFTIYSDDSTVTKAIFTCDVGYTLDGYSELTCEETGQWDNEIPQCECNEPLSPDNGTVTVSNDKTQAEYMCNLGFTLHGVSTRTCQSEGTGWSSSDPVCVGCSTLSSPSNGSVTLSTNGVLTVATYSCDVGFTLNGDVTSQCQVDVTWSTVPPTCLSTASPSECNSGDSGGSNLLPAVIVLAILALCLGIAFGLSVFYIWKLKTKAQGSSNTKASNQNGTFSYDFPASKAPMDHSQHIMDFRNTSSAMSAPMGHHPSPRIDSITPRSLSTTVSSNSLHLSHLNLIREDTTSSVIFDQNNPAPWIKRPKHEHGTSLSTGLFPPITESGTNLTSPRGNNNPGLKYPRKKKQSFTKKMQRQNSINAGKTDVSDKKQGKSRIVKAESVKPMSRPKVMVNRNGSIPKSIGTASNSVMAVPGRKPSEQLARASTPVNHHIEVEDPDQCRTPRSNKFATVQ
ncbi:CUB and sushi domain-containing protein 3-like [Mercenaria mercenaria]|uniref:CUB and sushi domain-containing protein 3-like n=1 Tax=Mercenaria mercenaria TaxID=6596 RepID=UPI00234ED629|nr:CUB and sushi domain-containing protein 3-like [Mercenaria mercenaria]